MTSYRFGSTDPKAINETLVAMNREFAKQRTQNASSYLSMSDLAVRLSNMLTLVNNQISNYTYQNTYMKSLIENL